MNEDLRIEILNQFYKAMYDRPAVYWAGMKIAIEIIKGGKENDRK